MALCYIQLLFNSCIKILYIIYRCYLYAMLYKLM